MVLKIANSNSPFTFVAKESEIENGIDIRDILVRLQSDDEMIRKAAKKRLLNIIFKKDNTQLNFTKKH